MDDVRVHIPLNMNTECIYIYVGDKTYPFSKLQLLFLKKIYENDIEFLDKIKREREHVYWKMIHKLKKKGLIIGRGRPYRLTREGLKVLKAYSIVFKDEGNEKEEEKI